MERSEDTPSQELGANTSGKKIESSWDKINRKEIDIKASNLAIKLFKGMVTPPPGYTTLGYIRPPRLEDVLASLRKFLSEMMMIYVQYFDRLNIPLTSSTLDDIWTKGIKPKWEKMVICLGEFLADEFKSKSPSIPNVDVIDIYEEGHDQWLAKIEEAISNEKFGQRELPGSSISNTIGQNIADTEEELLPERLNRGKYCVQVADEVRRIKHLYTGTGRGMREIKLENPEFAVWKVMETLSQDDQDTFDRPRTWGGPVGYARNILAKYYGKSNETIADWMKDFKRHNRSHKQTK